MCIRLPYREAQIALKLQNIKIGISHLERLLQSYGKVFEKEYLEVLKKLAAQTLERRKHSGVVVIEIDGCMVMEKNKPIEGKCEGREVKQVVIYRNGNSKERNSFATARGLVTFERCLHGLLRTIAKQGDKLIGLGDGAPWIDERFDMLGIEIRILDVYHALDYLDKIMKILDFSESQRTFHRRQWFRGEVNARNWLEEYLPSPKHCSKWAKDTQKALTYLNKRIDQMDYADFKSKGYPIGSGQIEGANKTVIAARMKRGGMRWSHEGINHMAALRSAQYSKDSLVDFHEVRLKAFISN